MRRVYALAVAALSVYGLADAFASKGSEPAGHNGSRSFVADIVDLPIITEHQTNDTRERLPTAPKATTITVTPAVHEVHLAASARPKNTGIAVARRATRAHTRVKPITPPTDLFPPDYAAANAAGAVQKWVALAQTGAGVGPGCASRSWSQPDAAGVPVLICN